MKELHAGPETDRLVVDAIGVPVRADEDGDLWIAANLLSDDLSFSRGEVVFMPSRNVDDAFWAAGKVAREGFAVYTPHPSKIIDEKSWKCVIGVGWDRFNQCTLNNAVAFAKTPALAVCGAILLLKHHEQ